MGQDQRQMATLVPDDSLLRFLLLKEKFSCCNTRHFHPGKVAPSRVMFTSDRAYLAISFWIAILLPIKQYLRTTKQFLSWWQSFFETCALSEKWKSYLLLANIILNIWTPQRYFDRVHLTHEISQITFWLVYLLVVHNLEEPKFYRIDSLSDP